MIVETFVDPEQFSGTVYAANRWKEFGKTDGFGRVSRDDYERHDRPKRLFARELVPGACRSLQAEHLKPSRAPVEAKVPALEAIFLKIQTQIRGSAPRDELIVMDGKEPTSGSGAAILTAVSVPSQLPRQCDYALGKSLPKTSAFFTRHRWR